MTSGAVTINDEGTAGAHATKGPFTAGTLGNLTGSWGKTGAGGAIVSWLALFGGTSAPVLAVLAVGTCCGIGLEIMRTWLPGPNPWGGTTNRALLRTICVPAASGAEVLMTTLCCTVPVADVANWVLVVAAEEIDV